MPYYMDCSRYTDARHLQYLNFTKQCEKTVWGGSRRHRCPNEFVADQGRKVVQACCGGSQTCSVSSFDCSAVPDDPAAPTCRCLVEELYSRCYSHEEWEHDLSQFGIKDRFALQEFVDTCQGINAQGSCPLPAKDPRAGH